MRMLLPLMGPCINMSLTKHFPISRREVPGVAVMPESHWPPVPLSNKIADMSTEEARDLVVKGCTSGVQLEIMAGCIWQLLAWGVRPWSLMRHPEPRGSQEIQALAVFWQIHRWAYLLIPPRQIPTRANSVEG